MSIAWFATVTRVEADPDFPDGSWSRVTAEIIGGGPLHGHVAPWPVHATPRQCKELIVGSAVINPHYQPVGMKCALEFMPTKPSGWRFTALWDFGMTLRLPSAEVAQPPSPTLVAAALAHVNLHRERHGFRPLNFGPVTWLSHSPPAEGWSDEDIIAEAKRLGWRP